MWLGEQDEGSSGGLELPGQVPDSTGGGAFGHSPWEEVASGLGFEPRGGIGQAGEGRASGQQGVKAARVTWYPCNAKCEVKTEGMRWRRRREPGHGALF